MEAASTTSQMSIPMRSASIAISLTSAMFTERKMFSSSLESSATSGVETAHDLVADRRVDGDGGLGARGREPADDLRRRAQRVVGAARVDALGRERQREVLARPQPGLLQQRHQVLARRARERRRLQDHGLAAPDHARQRLRGADSSGPRSGSRLRVSGVGTQTRIASASCSST